MELTCIRCPMGCTLSVTVENNTVTKVTGNTCPRGEDYAKTEAVAPVRTVTGTVRVQNGLHPVVAVKTLPEIPKDKIFDVAKEIRSFETTAPIHIGDVLIKNIADTGSNLIATANS